MPLSLIGKIPRVQAIHGCVVSKESRVFALSTIDGRILFYTFDGEDAGSKFEDLDLNPGQEYLPSCMRKEQFVGIGMVSEDLMCLWWEDTQMIAFYKPSVGEKSLKKVCTNIDSIQDVTVVDNMTVEIIGEEGMSEMYNLEEDRFYPAPSRERHEEPTSDTEEGEDEEEGVIDEMQEYVPLEDREYEGVFVLLDDKRAVYCKRHVVYLFEYSLAHAHAHHTRQWGLSPQRFSDCLASPR
jgi:hypothetical protein